MKTFKYYMNILTSNWESYLWSVAIFLVPIKGIMITIGLFVLLDMFTGIWAARRKKVRITSRKMIATVYKILVYQFVIIGTFLIDENITESLFQSVLSVDNFVTKVMALVMIFIELTSINENLFKIWGVNMWTKFRQMLKGGAEVISDIKDVKDEAES